MKKTHLARIEFLVDMYGNSAGERVWIEAEDGDNLYYTDGFERWCYVEKSLAGTEYKYVTMKA